MAWKNIKQRSFADDLLVNHSAIEELDDVHDLINWERIENLLSDIHTKVQGEKAWPGEISIIDASVIKAKNNRPNKDKDGGNTQDKEAAYNVKNGSDGKRKTTYGFKAHINAEEDGFIKRYEFTAGNVHDSNVFESLLTGKEKEAFADSAYKSKKHDESLKAKHITNRVLNRAYRNKPLTEQQKKSNRLASGTRSIVERVFGVLKLHYAMGNARYLGLARNKARFGLMCVAHNIKRGLTLHRQYCEA